MATKDLFVNSRIEIKGVNFTINRIEKIISDTGLLRLIKKETRL